MSTPLDQFKQIWEITRYFAAQVHEAEARGRRDELERLRQQVYAIVGREPAAAPVERYVKLRLAALQDTTGEGKHE